MRKCLFVLLFVSASLVSHAATTGAGLGMRNDGSSMQQADAKRQLVATVTSVDAKNKTISFEEMRTPVAVTSATVFDDEVQLSKLKPGMKVNLTVITSADNKTEAVEVRKAG
jgi:Cu/Ag efflux protein CusF